MRVRKPLATALALSLPTATLAEEQVNPFILEEVIVTAEKRSANLQDVPAAISAFDAETIETSGIGDIDKIQSSMPSVSVGGESKSRPFIFIRGIGTRKFDIGTDGSIGVFVDEIYNPRFSSTLTGIMDMERVEVLKGPQGTLYGRNTIGGAMNMISKQPTNEVEGKVKAALGNDGYYVASGMLSGPIVEDELLGRISLGSTDVDGTLKDTVSGNDNNNRINSARVSLLALPFDQWELNLIAEYNDVESDASLGEPVVGGSPVQPVFGVASQPVMEATLTRALTPMLGPAAAPTAAALAPGFSVSSVEINDALATSAEDTYSNTYSKPGSVERNNDLLAFKAGYSGENFDFLSITSRTSEDYTETRDFDGTSLETLGTAVDQTSTQYSQEFRFSSVSGGAFTFNDKLNWVAGIYYFADDAERSDTFTWGTDSVSVNMTNALAFAGAPGLAMTTSNPDIGTVKLETQSIALYGQATYALTPSMGLTLGLRHTRDEKEFTYIGDTSSPGLADFNVGDTLVFEATDPKITLDYQLAEDVMVYATYASGFKSGGVQFAVINAASAQQSFDEETLTMYEVGLKSRLLNQRLQLNAAAYRYDYVDQQVQSIIDIEGTPTALTQNAGESTIDGLEIELLAQVSEALRLSFNYAYQDATFDQFESLTGSREGNHLAFAPEHAFTTTVSYDISLGDKGDLTLQGNYVWKDDYYFDFDNSDIARQDAYGVANLAAWWDLPNGQTRIRAFCDNCADEEYLLNVVVFPSNQGGRQTWASPRRYGLEVTHAF